ncbi:hypothetical protein AAIB33_08050 [Microbacterium sp. AZCO]|uniref:hypothetical protein n=1 Tax=Microbacterium sp. AZCO TaxID=3142976 RepID=UPI0031F47455
MMRSADSEKPGYETIERLVGEDVARLGHYRRRLGRPMVPSEMTLVWIEALKAAGVTKATLARATAEGRKWPDALPFVVEMPCPFEHRTEDRRALASTWLLIEENGMAVLDGASPCSHCTQPDIREWLLTCPICEADLDGFVPWLGREVLHLRNHLFGRGLSPLEYVWAVLGVLVDGSRRAHWIDDPDTAINDFIASKVSHGGLSEAAAVPLALEEHRRALQSDADRIEMDRPVPPVTIEEYIDQRKADLKAAGRSGRGSSDVPSTRSTPEVPAKPMTVDEAVVWLDEQKAKDGSLLVSEQASQRDALALVNDIPGHPAKRLVESAQTIRKSRPRP